MLSFIYEKCMMPIYRKVCFTSNLLKSQLALISETDDQNESFAELFVPFSLESAISILFDVLNVFTMQHEDAYRRIFWKHPLNGSKMALMHINGLFKAH